jgi:hypothetical protein
MKLLISSLLCFICALNISAQFTFSGKWQGIIVKNDETWEKGQPIYFDFEVVNNLIDGK